MHPMRFAISLPVANSTDAHRFYTKVFGDGACSLDGNTASLQVGGTNVFFIDLDEFNLLLKPADSEAQFVTGKYSSVLSCTVPTRDELYASLKAAADAGGKPCGQAVSYPWGMAAYFTDPDGHLWEILWRDPKQD
jgi:uncharacterized protein